MYSLDVETLIGVLQGLKVRGSIEAIVFSSIVDIPARSRVVLELHEGRVLSATIYHPQGYILFQGKEVLERIRQRVLTWQLSETPSTNSNNAFPADVAEQRLYASTQSTQPKQQTQPMRPVQSVQPVQPKQQSLMRPQAALPPASLDTFIPVRLQTPLSSQQQWSRARMRIYALVNGKNSIAYIARLLSLPPETVYVELKALQAERMIDIK